MPWIKKIIPFYRKFQYYVLVTNVLLISGLLLSCDIPEETFTNPLDIESNAEKGIAPPAIVFFPDNIETDLGESFTMEVFALEVDSVGGAQIEIDYNASILSVSSVSKGSFFQGGNDPIFISEHDNGKLFIYVTYMGPDSAAVSGTGDIAAIVFNTKIPGETIITINEMTVLLDKNAIPIQINGLGESVVNAK